MASHRVSSESPQEEFHWLMQTISLRLALPIFLGFWILDLIFVPHLKWEFLALRSLMAPVSLTTYWFFRHTRPRLWISEIVCNAFCLTCALVIMAMSIRSGALQSPYFAALNMVALATVPFLPFRTAALAMNIFCIYVPWAAFGLLYLQSLSDFRYFVAHSGPMVCTVIIALVLRSITAGIRSSERRATLKLGEVARQVAHDIRSPLTALKVGIDDLQNVSPSSLTLIRSALLRIEDIAGDLLGKHGAVRSANEGIADLWINPLLLRLISEKQLEFRSRPEIQFRTDFASNSYSSFTAVNQGEFLRAVSNLINNAVESMKSGGEVVVSLSVVHNKIHLHIRDTGQGIDGLVLAKLRESNFSHGKVGGHGLGLAQVRAAALAWQGSFEIDSIPGTGTTATLTLPLKTAPSWFASEIVIPSGWQVVVADDDLLAHGVWSARFSEIHPAISVKHLESIEQLDSFVAKHGTKRVLFLLDHDFRSDTVNGLDRIQSLRLHHAILVTNRFDDPQIQKRTIELGKKILPKQLIPMVSIQTTS